MLEGSGGRKQQYSFGYDGSLVVLRETTVTGKIVAVPAVNRIQKLQEGLFVLGVRVYF